MQLPQLPIPSAPPPPLQPLGLAHDDPYLQRMISFRGPRKARLSGPLRHRAATSVRLDLPTSPYTPTYTEPAPATCPGPRPTPPIVAAPPSAPPALYTPAGPLLAAPPLPPAAAQPTPTSPMPAYPAQRTISPPYRGPSYPAPVVLRPHALRPVPTPPSYHPPPTYRGSLCLRSRPPPPRAPRPASLPTAPSDLPAISPGAHHCRSPLPPPPPSPIPPFALNFASGLLMPSTSDTAARDLELDTTPAPPVTTTAAESPSSRSPPQVPPRPAHVPMLSTPLAMMTAPPLPERPRPAHAHGYLDFRGFSTLPTHLGAMMGGRMNSFRQHIAIWCRRILGDAYGDGVT